MEIDELPPEMKHRASEVRADDRYHSLMGHEDTGLRASTADFGCIFLSQGQSIKGRPGIWTCRSISQQQKGKIAPCLPLYLSPLFHGLKETFKVGTSEKSSKPPQNQIGDVFHISPYTFPPKKYV